MKFDDIFKDAGRHFWIALDDIKVAANSYFLARKGDAFIWHADLLHGGGSVTDDQTTRRSVVVREAA